jgi:heat shock protein HslJ
MNDTPTHRHKDKKARTETGTDDNVDDTSLSPPSLGTTQTELTDERTEFKAAMATMQDTLSKKIQSIKDANNAKARQAETRIQQAEKTYIAAQETIVKENETLSQTHNNILEAFTNIGCNVCMAQVKQDKQNLAMKQMISSMMHILVGIHQYLANGTSPKPLLQEQVSHLMQSTLEADNGNGALGSDTTKNSSTTQQASGRMN